MTDQEQQATTPPEPWWRPRLLTLSAFLLIPTLYVLGRGYWDAWLTAHGLSSATFPLTVDQAVYLSYQAVLWLGITTLPVITQVVYLILSLIILWAATAIFLWLQQPLKKLLRGKLSPYIRKPIAWIDALISRYRSMLLAAARSYSIAATPFLLVAGGLLIFILLLLPLIAGNVVGKWQGNRSHDALVTRIAAGTYTESEQVFITDSHDVLLLIACSDLGCAGANARGSEFVRWDRIDRIVPAKVYAAANRGTK